MRSSSKVDYPPLNQERRIIIEMLKRGLDRRDIAKILNISGEYTTMLINDTRQNGYYQNLLAFILRKKPEELFDAR